MDPLVSRMETRLADGGLLAILFGLALRWVVWFALTRSNPLLDSQLIAGGILIALLNLAALFLPRSAAAVPMLLGALGGLYAITLAPRYLWPTGDRPDWLVWSVAAFALASFGARWYMARRWSAEISGKGWAWIDNWAQERSLRARVLAKKALIALGYRRAREAAE